MKRKLITLEIYADDNNIIENINCIKDLLVEIKFKKFVLDGTIDVRVKENHVEMYKQMARMKEAE